jgi:hypothetical protein
MAVRAWANEHCAAVYAVCVVAGFPAAWAVATARDFAPAEKNTWRSRKKAGFALGVAAALEYIAAA